jgi:hypothetical protein
MLRLAAKNLKSGKSLKICRIWKKIVIKYTVNTGAFSLMLKSPAERERIISQKLLAFFDGACCDFQNGDITEVLAVSNPVRVIV